MSVCNCIECRQIRGSFDTPSAVYHPLDVPVSIEKVEPVKVEPMQSARLPKGLTALRKAVTNFIEHPEKFLDFSTLTPRNSEYDGPGFIIQGKSLSDITGLEKLGSGHYSDVYAIDENRVLKVVKRGDSGYARFVGIIRQTKNPHFPKILYSGIWAGKQVYILERLAESPSTGKSNLAYRFIEALQMDGSNPFVTLTNALISEASKILTDNNLSSDLHTRNLLWRGDVPVISDPCSEGY